MDWNFVEAQNLKGINAMVSNWVGEDVVPSGAFVTIVVVTCFLEPVWGDLGRVTTNVVPFTFV